jgi:hypothetical protein
VGGLSQFLNQAFMANVLNQAFMANGTDLVLMCGVVCRVRVVMCARFVVAQPIPRGKGALSELVSALRRALDA